MMMRNAIPLVLAITLTWALPAAAQGPPPGGPPPPPGENWEELMAKIAMVRLVRLSDALELDDETALELSRYLKEKDLDRAAVMKARGEIHREIRDYMESDVVDEALARDLLERGIDNERKAHDLHVATVQGLEDILTPTQQLKYVIVSREFEREVHEMIRDRKGKHGRPPGGTSD